MSGATCATCRFFGGGNQCRLKPPAWLSDGALFQPGWFFPRVDPGDWCGEHAPTPAVGGPELPDGWEWDANFPGITRAVARGNPRCIVEIMPNGIVTAMGAYVEDVEAVFAAHRARAGGAA